MERSEIKLFQEIINISLFTRAVKEEYFLGASCLSWHGHFFFFPSVGRRAYLFSVNTFGWKSGVLTTDEEMGMDRGMIGRVEFYQQLSSSVVHVSDVS